MVDNIDQEVLELLACPKCGGKLDLDQSQSLRCATCPKAYAIEDGIPILIADDTDSEHLGSEETLYAEMSRYAAGGAERGLAEWNRSKKEFIDFALKTGPSWEGKIVGYIGCGVNTFEEELRSHGAIPVHMELIQSMLRTLKGKSATNLINCDALKLPFVKRSFDVILVVDLIHHFYASGISTPLKEISRVLKPGGLLYVEEPNRMAFLRLPIAILPHRARILLRRIRHGLFPGRHGKPADYEAPLIASNIEAAEPAFSVTRRANLRTYPSAPGWFVRIWSPAARLFPPLGKYLSYHWLVQMVKVGGGT
jgi:uncharacterized protein YbaR (Trm112 family)